MGKIADIFATLVILVSITVLVVWMSIDLEKDYSGSILVIDGDTVIIGREKIRLEGIDAPELDQLCSTKGVSYQCGVKSRAHLKALSKKGQMHCKAWQRDKYERLLGQCFVGEIDINARMVGDGWAVAFGSYYRQEKHARQQEIGIWAGKFDRPRDWRHLRGNVVEPSHKVGKGEWWKIL